MFVAFPGRHDQDARPRLVHDGKDAFHLGHGSPSKLEHADHGLFTEDKISTAG